MRFITFVKTPTTSAPPPELMGAIGQFGAEAAEAGVFVETGGLAPDVASTKIKVADGAVTPVDGPFEGEQLVSAYSIFDVQSKEEALEWATRFMDLHAKYWPEWTGETEVRQIFGPEEMGNFGG